MTTVTMRSRPFTTETGEIESWTTEAYNNVILRGLEVETEYTLVELQNAEGYDWEAAAEGRL